MFDAYPVMSSGTYGHLIVTVIMEANNNWNQQHIYWLFCIFFFFLMTSDFPERALV